MKVKTCIVAVLTGLLLVPGISFAAGSGVNPDELHITELEAKVRQLAEAASALQDDIRYLKKELEDSKDLASDYTRAIEGYNEVMEIKETSIRMSADTGRPYDLPVLLDQSVKKLGIALPSGRKFEGYPELESYVKQAAKDLPRLKQTIAEHKELISEVQKSYDSLKSEQRIYNTALTKRRSHLAILGLWKFQGKNAFVRITNLSDYNGCTIWDADKIPSYIAVAQGKGLDDFENGEIVFFLYKADIMEPYYYTGSEYEWGKAKTERWGSPKMTNIRVRVDTASKKMHYKSRDQYLVLDKVE